MAMIEYVDYADYLEVLNIMHVRHTRSPTIQIGHYSADDYELRITNFVTNCELQSRVMLGKRRVFAKCILPSRRFEVVRKDLL